MKSWSGCVREVSHLLRYFADVCVLSEQKNLLNPKWTIPLTGLDFSRVSAMSIGNLLSHDAQNSGSDVGASALGRKLVEQRRTLSDLTIDNMRDKACRCYGSRVTGVKAQGNKGGFLSAFYRSSTLLSSVSWLLGALLSLQAPI